MFVLVLIYPHYLFQYFNYYFFYYFLIHWFFNAYFLKKTHDDYHQLYHDFSFILIKIIPHIFLFGIFILQS